MRRWERPGPGQPSSVTYIHPHGDHDCVCPVDGTVVTVGEGEKCSGIACPNCGARMRAVDIGERRDTWVGNASPEGAGLSTGLLFLGGIVGGFIVLASLARVGTK